MMREKTLKLVVTFHTTADAMAVEKACRDRNAPGRLIPVPRSISAGCGLAWCAELSEYDILKEVIAAIGVEEEEIHQCML